MVFWEFYIVKIFFSIVITIQRIHLHTPVGNTSDIYRSFYFQSIQFCNKLMSSTKIDGNFFLFKNILYVYIYKYIYVCMYDHVFI